MLRVIPSLLFYCILFASSPGLHAASAHNGFDLSNSLIPVERIHKGGPVKDGIPSIDHPQFVRAEAADFIKDQDRVLALRYQGVEKAYPIAIMNWHEIVNDRFQDTAIAVTFCPLCGSGMAYLATFDGATHQFGVSGLLYNSDVLLYDRSTDSLWSQLMSQAISGPKAGSKLKPIALSHTTWADWKQRHPQTLVMTENTGFIRDYQRNPYEKYRQNRKLLFPVNHADRRYHPKHQVMGIELDGATKVYPFSELARMPARFKDTFAGRTVNIHFNQEHQTANIYAADNRELASVITFWFAWVAFHPDTLIFEHRKTD